MSVDGVCRYCLGSGWVDCDVPWCTEEGHGAPCWCRRTPPVPEQEHHWAVIAKAWTGYRDRARQALKGNR